MKAILLAAALVTAVAVTHKSEAEPFNVKSVMPGALSRGGSSGARGSRAPLNDSDLNGLCKKGYSDAIFLYGKGSGKTVNCGSNTLKYSNISMNSDKKALGVIYNAIQNGGKTYVHCWYGVHASGYIAAVALMQFCGYSAEQAVSYWNNHVPPSIRYPKVQAKIRAFTPSSGMNLSSGQASRFCP